MVESKNVAEIELVERNDAPQAPKKRPNKMVEKKLKKGKKSIQRYISVV